MSTKEERRLLKTQTTTGEIFQGWDTDALLEHIEYLNEKLSWPPLSEEPKALYLQTIKVIKTVINNKS